MSERLRARDLAFLTAETATTPMHNATVEIFDPGDVGLRPRHARPADRRPDRLRAALPPAGALGARLTWPTRSGSTTRTSTSATTYAARRCRVPGTMDQLRELVARIVSRPLDRNRPAVGGLLRRGARGRPRRRALQGPPGPGGRRADRRPRPGAARPDARAARAGRRTSGARAVRSRRPVWCWRRSATPSLAVHRASRRCAAPPTPGGAAPTQPPAASARSSTRSPTGAPSRTPRSAGRCRSSAAS